MITCEIEKFCERYCRMFDERDWSLFDELFIEESELYFDNKIFGIPFGKKGKSKEVLKWLKEIFYFHNYSSHRMSNATIVDVTNEDIYIVHCGMENYQTLLFFTYFSSAKYILHLRENTCEKQNNLICVYVHEIGGVFSPVVTFNNILFFFSLSFIFIFIFKLKY